MFFATIKLEAINRNGLVLLLLLSWAGGFTTLHVHPSLRRRRRRLLLCSCVVGGGDYARTRADKWGHAKWSRFATSREILTYIVKNTTLMCCTCSSNIIIAMRRTRTFVHVSVIRECIIIYLLTVWFTCRKRSLLLCVSCCCSSYILVPAMPATMDVATMLQSVVFMHFVQNNRETYQAILFSCLPA